MWPPASQHLEKRHPDLHAGGSVFGNAPRGKQLGGCMVTPGASTRARTLPQPTQGCTRLWAQSGGAKPGHCPQRAHTTRQQLL